MRQTHEQATHVLVLAASLQPYYSRALSEVEICSRILITSLGATIMDLARRLISQKTLVSTPGQGH